jgi:anti-sigma28 factor (negative regulator of flagellin synthesis)
MRVNDQNVTGASAGGAGRTQEAQRSERSAGARAGTPASGGDRVELSSTLSSLSRALSESRGGRAAKVQALAAQYQSGQYQSDSTATSRAIIGEAVASMAR